MNRLLVGIASIVIALGVVGCQAPLAENQPDQPLKKDKPLVADVPAGVPINFDTKNTIEEARGFREGASNVPGGASGTQPGGNAQSLPVGGRPRLFLARNDPFALTPDQMQFEKAQAKEKLLQDMGNFYPVVAPAEAQEVPPVMQPQPYRRLAGVVVGQSVVGIIELNGNDQQLIRPGQLVPGTEWRVVSIDTDKAILRRGGNILPHEIVVRLESRPFGSGSSSSGGGSSGIPNGSGPGRNGAPSGGGGPSGAGSVGD